MPRSLLLVPVLCLVLLGAILAGCTTPVPLQETGAVIVTSVPAGAEIYLDNEYHGTTPATITTVPAGSHMVGVRKTGYEQWSAPVTVVKGNSSTVTAVLVSTPVILPVTFATTASPAVSKDLPQIHVDGYWTYPQGRSGTANPVPLVVHTEAYNVGYGDAREVTVSANFYYEGRMICWNTIYLGTLVAGGHGSKDTLVSCSLPSGLAGNELAIRFENPVVTR